MLLDRDGTIIVERHYLSDPNAVELLPGAVSGLQRMRKLGLGLVAITNQSAIGRGFFDESRLNQIHARMSSLLQAEEIVLDGIYFCPHKPEANCGCRKPRTALAHLAEQELGFRSRDGFVIGDKECDIELGHRLDAMTFLVRTGYGSRTDSEKTTRPDFVVADLDEAATKIEYLLQTGHERLG